VGVSAANPTGYAYTSTGSQEAFFNRQAWAGFSGKFGELRAGTQDSIGFQTNVGYDLNGAANDSQASLLAGVPTVGNGARTLAQYITPEFAGFKAQLGYQPKGDNVALVDATGGAQASYAAAVSYAKGALAATVSYESATTTTVAINSSAANNWSAVSASYDFGVAKVVGTAANGGSGFKGYNVGVQVPVAGVNVGVQYANNTDTKDTGTEVFANKEVLKNTTAYVDYGKKHIDSALTTSGLASGGYDVFSLGVIWTF
jgi:predicted porin